MALLAVVVTALYLPTLHHGFLYDDLFYVTENPVVRTGLTLAGTRWAFTNFSAGYWHPLTWLSHMADVQFFGLNSGLHHATGLALHVMNSALLLLVLVRLTGSLWRPAIVAALFALHPLHVESAAWVAERKDVLSSFFWMLALLAHERRARASGRRADAAVALFFLLAILAKPIVVTLPLVLLVLDGWPLGRLAAGPGLVTVRRALLEKVPLFALTAVTVGLTILPQASTEVLPSLKVIAPRLENAAVSAVIYILKTFWPSGLAAFYPLSTQGQPWWVWSAALLFIVALSAFAVRERRRRPWLAAGWTWYLVTFLPSSGIVQVSFCARADRYTYLPLVGIFVIVAWGGAEALAHLRRGRVVGALAALAVLAALAGTSRVQLGYWKDGLTLFRHALAVTENNWLAHFGVARALQDQGDLAGAEEHYRRALVFNPGYKEAINNLGILIARRGDLQSALACFIQAASLAPQDAFPQLNIGRANERLGKRAAAREAYLRALNLDPGLAEARAGLTRLGPAP
jgi:hypothetical protein